MRLAFSFSERAPSKLGRVEEMKVIDIGKARAETPGTADVTHFNNAGAALMPRPVIDAVKQHIDREAAMGGYEAADHTLDAQERVYSAAAEMLNCYSDEIAVVENATVAWCMAFYGFAQTLKAGDRILTAEAEYAANYIAYLQVAKRSGAVIDVVPSTEDGRLCVESLGNMIDDRVKLISVTHVPTNGGLVNPAADIGEIARSAGIAYLLDACQSIGQMPIDVEAIGCDMLSVTGRKYLRGPRGTGFLYIRREMMERFEPPMLDLHAATWTAKDQYEMRPNARRFENWENNIAAKIGLGVALDYALAWGLDAIKTRIDELSADMRRRLGEIPGLTVHDLGPSPCGIVTFTLDGHDPLDIRAALAAEGINVSVSRLTSTRLDMAARGLDAVVRASVHYYNSEDEVDRLVAAVGDVSAG